MNSYHFVKLTKDGWRSPPSGQDDFNELDANGVPAVHHPENVLECFSETELVERLQIYKVATVDPTPGEAIVSGPNYELKDGRVTQSWVTAVPEVQPPRFDELPKGREPSDVERQFAKDVIEREKSSVRRIVFGGLHIRQYAMKANEVHQGHKHNLDHVTYLHSGKLLCQVKGFPDEVFEGPVPIPIKKDFWHRFTALTNVSYSCIFALRDKDGEITDTLGSLVPGMDEQLNDCSTCAISSGCSAE